MNTNKAVRVVRHFRNGGRIFQKGDVFTPNGIYRDYLLRFGLAVVIEPEEVIEPPVAVVTPPVVPPVVAAPVELPRRSKMKAK